MKVTRFLLSALLLGAMATTASAQGTVSLNWDTCIGPINKAIAPGTIADLQASVIGHSQPHQAYQVYVALGSGNAGALRDAWRFDAAGCQGSALITINHLSPGTLSKACPSFQGANASIQIKDYSFDALTGKARAVLANTYPAGVAVVNPATRYFLAQFKFDHTFSTAGPSDPGNTCGGLEVAVCAHLTRTSWLSPDGVETPWAWGQEYVTANDAGNTSGCPGATPAVPTTWGSVKAQYKR
jgi:hypothetical protein